MITLKLRHVVELEAEDEDFSASVVQWLWNSGGHLEIFVRPRPT
jgi:hypothetical protein